jgi:hypothetical protein
MAKKIKTENIPCFMCHKMLDPKTLKCKGCGLTYKVEIEKRLNEEVVVIDYDNQDTKKAMSRLEEI